MPRPAMTRAPSFGRVRIALAAFIAAVLLTVAVPQTSFAAQTPMGGGASLSGTLTDSSGAPLSGITVTVQQQRLASSEYGEVFTTSTAVDGGYSFTGLDDTWDYSVSWSTAGFVTGRPDDGDLYNYRPPIEVGPGESVVGIDGIVYHAGSATVQAVQDPVFTSFGSATWGMWAYRWDPDTGVWLDAGWQYENGAGYATLTGLRPGLYSFVAEFGRVSPNIGGYIAIPSRDTYEVAEGSSDTSATILVGEPGKLSGASSLYRSLDYAAGFLGTDVGSSVAISQKGTGTLQKFQHGNIYSARLYGTWAVSGAILTEYEAQGEVAGALGWPTGPAVCTASGFCSQTFQDEQSITVSPTIAEVYALWGGAAGPLGAAGASETYGGDGTVQHFAGGSIYRSTLYGTHVVWAGPIRDVYFAANAVAGEYGWPNSDRVCSAGLCTQTFSGGTIVESQLVATTPPTVGGVPTVGATLTATDGAYSPAATSHSYAWLRDGVRIAGATASTYTPLEADYGHTLQVEVTANRVGSYGVVTLSDPTAPVSGGAAFADASDPMSTFYPYIEWMASSGISTGTPNPPGKPLYKPATSVSRQAMASFLYKLSEDTFTPPAEPTFADVDSSNPFYMAIEWMASEGISTGTPQESGKPLYKPADPVSRQSMAIFLARYGGIDTSTPPTTQSFADVPTTATSAAAIAWMKESGISTGTAQPSGLPLYKPLDPVSRQAMAAFLYRLAHLP